MWSVTALLMPMVPSHCSSTAGCRSLTGPQRRAMSRARPRLDFLDRNGTWGLPNNMAMRDLTYRILYEFLPVILSTLVPECEDQFTNEQVEVSLKKVCCCLESVQCCFDLCCILPCLRCVTTNRRWPVRLLYVWRPYLDCQLVSPSLLGTTCSASMQTF